HAIQELRAGAAVSAEPVARAAVVEGGVDLARVDHAAALDELQHGAGLLPARARPRLARRSRVHQALRGARQYAVVDEEVFLDSEARVARLQLARPVGVDAVAQRQVLRAGGRADRVEL